MARTVIEEQGPTNGYVEDRSGPAVGLMIGLLLAVVVLIVAFLFLRDDDTVPATGDNGTSNDPGTSQSSEPSSEPTESSTEPSAEATTAP